MAEEVVAHDVAVAEFERMCKSRRVDIDESGMSADDLESFEDVKSKIVGAIKRGEITVDDDGTPTFTPPVPGAKGLTFYKATGATFMASDDAKENDKVKKTVAMLTEVTRSAKGDIAKLEAPDFKICQALLQLFLA